MTQAIDSQAVVQYLLDHPDFFQENSGILSELHLTSPILGKAISLHERQIEVLRAKHKALELQISRLMYTAQENTLLARKMLIWTQNLLKERNEFDKPQLLITELKSIFSVPSVNLRMWNIREEYKTAWFTQNVADNIHDFVDELEGPYCGKPDNPSIVQWLDRAPSIRSIALLPLKKDKESLPFGLLVLGSQDETRFQDDMGTDFLANLANTASAALSNLLVIE